MCATCGCTTEYPPAAPAVGHPGGHDHRHDGHEHGHDHGHESAAGRTLRLEQDVLAKNNQVAERNRTWLTEHGVLALNVMSAPGSGKTTLLERTVRDLGATLPISVAEGDQATRLDADRVRAAGAPVVQINTGAGCHLDAAMLAGALRELDPPERSVVFVENVGNLVCPALFDLGEHSKVVVMSVTEGADKPLKYPHMFRVADVVLLNKVDLLPYVQFDVDRCVEGARRVNPGVTVLPVSATRGDGLDTWYAWLRSHLPAG